MAIPGALCLERNAKCRCRPAGAAKLGHQPEGLAAVLSGEPSDEEAPHESSSDRHADGRPDALGEALWDLIFDGWLLASSHSSRCSCACPLRMHSYMASTRRAQTRPTRPHRLTQAPRIPLSSTYPRTAMYSRRRPSTPQASVTGASRRLTPK